MYSSAELRQIQVGEQSLSLGTISDNANGPFCKAISLTSLELK